MDSKTLDDVELILLSEISGSGEFSTVIERFLSEDVSQYEGDMVLFKKRPSNDRIAIGAHWDTSGAEMAASELIDLCRELEAEYRETSPFRRDGIAKARRIKRGASR